MAPTKTKKTRGQLLQWLPAKRTRRAGNKKKAPATSGKGHLTRDEDAVTQKLDPLMKSMADLSGKMQELSGRVEVTEQWQKEVEVSPASLHTSRPTKRRASP